MISGPVANGPLSSALTAFPSNAAAVGLAWITSSAILTTYSATKFLKYADNNKQLRSPSRILPMTMAKTPKSVLEVAFMRPFQNMSRPARLTLYRFAGSFALGLFLSSDFNVALRVSETISAAPAFLVPAVLLFIANLSNSVALDRIGIPLTYTSKCGIPLMTVALTFLMEGSSALPSPLALLTLIPIAAGIAAASWSSPTFEVFGFLAAVLSTLSQSALNVYSKRAISKTGINGPSAQRVMVGIGLVLILVVTICQHLQTVSTTNAVTAKPSIQDTDAPPAWLSILAFTAYHIEYVLSFMFVKLVQPITYGTCDAVRRLSIILVGKRMFGGSPLTPVNWAGILLALAGVVGYSIASNV
jgi:hypothetical protein